MQISTLRQNLLVNALPDTKLEQASCECYRAMFDDYEHALGFPPLMTMVAQP